MSTLQQREREREIQRERERAQEHLSQPSHTERERNREEESRLEQKLKELEEKGSVRLQRTASGGLDIQVIPVVIEKTVTAQTGLSLTLLQKHQANIYFDKLSFNPYSTRVGV